MTTLEPVHPSEPRVPVSPQLALRVAVLGGLAMAMFAIIFFRLWYLQVLSGEQYVQKANANRARDLPIAAPRGQILDREGQPIVASRTTNSVQIVPSALPPPGAPRLALYRHLGALLGMSPQRIEALVVKGRTALPYAPVAIKTDAGQGVLTVLAERQGEFPGVTQQPVSIRDYPNGPMAAQVLGYVGQVSKPELKLRAFRGVKQGTVVGQEGIEYYYDRYLRGTPGAQRVEVNAAGYPVPSSLPSTQPLAGHSLKVTLDFALEREGEKALLEGMEHARGGGKPAVAGAFVALDPRNGEVLAIGSSPSFDPNKFAKPLTESEYAALEGKAHVAGSSEESPAPLTDRAVNGTYPTGSTFKPITAMGALEAGVIDPSMGLGGGQCIYVSTQAFCNAGKADYGPVALVEALKVSSDTYFFETGELANSHGPVIQNMAKELGIGEQTRIDLPSEITGLVPTAAWPQTAVATALVIDVNVPHARKSKRYVVAAGRDAGVDRRRGEPSRHRREQGRGEDGVAEICRLDQQHSRRRVRGEPARERHVCSGFASSTSMTGMSSSIRYTSLHVLQTISCFSSRNSSSPLHFGQARISLSSFAMGIEAWISRKTRQLPEAGVAPERLVRPRPRHRRARGAVEKTEAQHVSAQESPQRPQRDLPCRSASPSCVQHPRRLLAIPLHLQQAVLERIVRVVQDRRVEAADRTVHDQLLVDGAAGVVPAGLAPEQAHVAIGPEAAVAEPDAAKVVPERQRVGRGAAEGRAAQLGRGPLVGVDGEHPFAARLHSRELVLASEVVEGPIQHARAERGGDLPGAVARAAIHHQDLVAEALQRRDTVR